MHRIRRLAAAALFAAAGSASALAQTAPMPAAAQGAPMQPGQPMSLGRIAGERSIRMVMINDNASVTLVHDMAPGLPEVVYDTAAPSMRVGNDGAIPRLTVGSGNMIDVQYDRR